jgi:hypothetical protein
MIRTEASILISRPIEEVFDYVAIDFFKNYQRWSPEVVSVRTISDGPISLGATGEQVRIDSGFRTQCRFRVSVFEQARRIDFTGISAPFLSSYRFQELHGKTRLTFIFEYTGPELLVLPFKRHIRHSVHQGSKRVVQKIKLLLESGADSGKNRLNATSRHSDPRLNTGCKAVH